MEILDCVVLAVEDQPSRMRERHLLCDSLARWDVAVDPSLDRGEVMQRWGPVGDHQAETLARRSEQDRRLERWMPLPKPDDRHCVVVLPRNIHLPGVAELRREGLNCKRDALWIVGHGFELTQDGPARRGLDRAPRRSRRRWTCSCLGRSTAGNGGEQNRDQEARRRSQPSQGGLRRRGAGSLAEGLHSLASQASSLPQALERSGRFTNGEDVSVGVLEPGALEALAVGDAVHGLQPREVVLLESTAGSLGRVPRDLLARLCRKRIAVGAPSPKPGDRSTSTGTA
jgi:hypothetical protein